MEVLGFALRAEATLQTLTQDALKTSEIEGDVLDREQVRSSLARRLGLETAGITPADQRAEAIAAVVLDATQNFARPLTADRLFFWHRWLFPNGGGRWNPIHAKRRSEHHAMVGLVPGSARPGVVGR